MGFDKTTESIAHFIGLFHLATEEGRLRTDYNKFKALERKEDEATDYSFEPVRLKAPFEIGDFEPHARYIPNQDVPAPAYYADVSFGASLPGPNDFFGIGSTPQYLPAAPFGASAGGYFGGSILPYVPIPSSAITITLQSITLFDNDVIGDTELAGFNSIESFHAALYHVAELAETLRPWAHDGLVAEIFEDPAAALAFRHTINAVVAPQIDGVSVSIVTDEAVENIVENGENVEEFTELDDHLPVYIAAKRDMLDKQEEGDQLAGHAKDALIFPDNDPHQNGAVATSAHKVSAGANETHNQVDIHTSWIDASVIAVAGDVINLNAISQVNILSDKDHFEGQDWTNPDSTSQAYNIASVTVNAEEEEDGEQDAPEGPLGLPNVWNLEVFEGDVTATNLVQQYTFATDHDRLELSFTANTTTIMTGENLTYNYAHAGEFGFGYDLILVGGTMVSMNLINQTNVLLDDDYFSGEGMGAAVISSNDNVLRNDVQITKEGADTHVEMLKEFKDALRDLNEGASELAQTVAKNEIFEGFDSLRALYIQGNLTQMNIVDQVNYLGDQDQVHMALDAMKSMLDDSPVTITTGSNLMTNTADILETGFDSQIMAGGEYYSDALLYQAELIDTDANPLGVGIAALATEAVAFLADELMPESMSESLESSGFNQDAHTGGTAMDIMQTMTT